MEFKDQIKLDKNRLDENAIDQSDFYDEWSKKWAASVLERDKAKERIGVATAESANDIRSHPQIYGWEQDKAATDGFVTSQVPLHPKVRKAQEELIEAQYQVNMMSSAKENLEQRVHSLDILTRLYTGAYFSARSNSELRKQAQEKIADVQKEGLTSPRLKKKV